MKKIFALLLCAALAAALCLPVLADEQQRIFDDLVVLSAEELESLNETAAELSRTLGLDVAILLSDPDIYQPEGLTLEEYAEDMYFYYGSLGPDGIILVMDHHTDEGFILGFGEGRSRLDENGAQLLMDSYEAEEYFYDAVEQYYYAAETALWLSAPIAGTEAGTEAGAEAETPVSPADPADEKDSGGFGVKFIFIALLVGLAVALIVVFTMKGKLKTVRKQSQAADYVRPGSLQITQQSDMFLYRNVDRSAKQQPTQNDTKKK